MTNHTNAPEAVTDHECDEFVGGIGGWKVGRVTRFSGSSDDAIEDADGNITLISR